MTGVTAQQYMETWIKQTNYPEVAVIMGTNPETSNTRVFFYQKRFLLSQEVIPDIDFPSPFGLEIFYFYNLICYLLLILFYALKI